MVAFQHGFMLTFNLKPTSILKRNPIVGELRGVQVEPQQETQKVVIGAHEPPRPPQNGGEVGPQNLTFGGSKLASILGVLAAKRRA